LSAFPLHRFLSNYLHGEEAVNADAIPCAWRNDYHDPLVPAKAGTWRLLPRQLQSPPGFPLARE
jgi:hypothetical protein